MQHEKQTERSADQGVERATRKALEAGPESP